MGDLVTSQGKNTMLENDCGDKEERRRKQVFEQHLETLDTREGDRYLILETPPR